MIAKTEVMFLMDSLCATRQLTEFSLSLHRDQKSLHQLSMKMAKRSLLKKLMRRN